MVSPTELIMRMTLLTKFDNLAPGMGNGGRRVLIGR